MIIVTIKFHVKKEKNHITSSTDDDKDEMVDVDDVNCFSTEIISSTWLEENRIMKKEWLISSAILFHAICSACHLEFPVYSSTSNLKSYSITSH